MSRDEGDSLKILKDPLLSNCLAKLPVQQGYADATTSSLASFTLGKNNMPTANGRVGCARKNGFAPAEIFIKTLKSEEVHLWEYRTMEDIQRRIYYFIEDVYNQKRFHSAIGHRLPCEFEMMLEPTSNPCQNTRMSVF